jgi:hypothetical protein
VEVVGYTQKHPESVLQSLMVIKLPRMKIDEHEPLQGEGVVLVVLVVVDPQLH